MSTNKRTARRHVSAASNAPTTGNAPVVNAASNLPKIADLAASYIGNVDQHLAEVQLDTKEIESAVSGEAGFIAVRAKGVALRPSMIALAAWDQGGTYDSTLDDAISDAHNKSGASGSPALNAAYLDALYLAVHASDAATVDKARFKADEDGNVLVGERARSNVRPQKFKDESGRFNLADATEAKGLIARQTADAQNRLAALGTVNAASPLASQIAHRDAEKVLKLWQNTAGTYESLCWLARMQNATKQALTQWRRRLFVDCIVNRLDVFATRDTSQTVAETYTGALGAAMTAHREWTVSQFADIGIKDDKRKEKIAARVADLPLRADAMVKHIAEALDTYLGAFETGAVKAKKTTKKQDLAAKLFKVARACEKEWKISGGASVGAGPLVSALHVATSKWWDAGLVDSKMTADQKAMVDQMSTILAMRSATTVAAQSIAKADGDASAKRQAELDKAAAAKVAAKQNAAPTPVATPTPTPAAQRLRGRARKLPTA